MLGTEVHVARQPIFDTNINVFGYELLFRNKFVDSYDGIDGDKATNCVIVNSFLLIGIKSLTNGKRAFINFTANSLKTNIPRSLPKELIAVEILEDIILDEEVINACIELKKNGYLLVLDDFEFLGKFEPIISMIDIIKIDFRSVLPHKRKQILQALKKYSIKFLAEKVETYEEFEEAVKMGYSYFQGYFFCKPMLVSHKEISEYKVNHLQLLWEVTHPELEFKQIEKIIKRDVALSYKLLILLIALKDIASDKPREIMLESLIRARFCEKLALHKMPKQLAANAFLIGLFSYIDVLLERPMQYILDEIHLEEELKDVLLEKDNNQLSMVYKLARSYERGDWSTYSCYAKKMEICENAVIHAYREAVIWVNSIA
ncbi:MAG: diguanylate phosphodiesterase metal dependent hydrolase domain containing protein [Firmicutes bacterium]|nr:diguanylate phosphodiesterase metal dependent hydrolase domain containing protein [Bacillota bacterium]